MILTALALLFASVLFAGIMSLTSCALRGRNAYREMTAERSALRRDVQQVTVTQFVPRTLATATMEAMSAPLRAAA